MATTNDKIGVLVGMFPDMDRTIISSVLGSKKGNVQGTIDALLAMNTTTLPSKEKEKVKNDIFNDVLNKVMRMPKDATAKRITGKYGLEINTVVWEDNARTKKSSWGPCISDMTLNVRNRMLPIVRYPNYTDLTWDVKMENIPLVVGNELKNGNLYNVNLKQYLEHFKLYISKPDQWPGTNTSLYAPKRDSHVIMSSQACFLPVPKSQDATFNVSILNYQSYARNPAVLAIVATSEGTSAQIVECDTFSRAQKLYFNKNGQRASFIGTRLTDDRERRGVAKEGAMTREEKAKNMIMIIQVPLKHTPKQRIQPQAFGYGGLDCLEEDEYCSLGGGFMAQPSAALMATQSNFSTGMRCAKRRRRPPTEQKRHEKADVEAAIVKVGEAEGEFNEIGGVKIERDDRYPVRVTLQFYKCTANGVVDDPSVKEINDSMKEARKQADGNKIGSLVVGGDTNRPTDVKQELQVAAWWDSFWLTYGSALNIGEDAAKKKIFTGGKFVNSNLNDVRDTVLHILRGSQPFHPVKPPTLYFD